MTKQPTPPKDKKKVRLSLTRDSVALGDDFDAPHVKKITQTALSDPIAFISHLSSNYLPSINGVGHTWDCVLNGVLVGVISVSKIIPKVSQIQYLKENKVHFIYHSTTY